MNLLKLPDRQRGAALIMAMVILLILTIIGVAALNTTSLEAKMAANLQDATRAFEAAESGLAKGDTSGFDLYTPKTVTYNFAGGVEATVKSTFKAFAPARRASSSQEMYGTGYNFANFEQESKGTTTSEAKAVIYQGLRRVTPEQTN